MKIEFSREALVNISGWPCLGYLTMRINWYPPIFECPPPIAESADHNSDNHSSIEPSTSTTRYFRPSESRNRVFRMPTLTNSMPRNVFSAKDTHITSKCVIAISWIWLHFFRQICFESWNLSLVCYRENCELCLQHEIILPRCDKFLLSIVEFRLKRGLF